MKKIYFFKRKKEVMIMEILQKRGALTHFQILGEISKQDPNLKQKDLAERLGITIQAVSENIKTFTE